jgi:hypothetical protein
LPKCWIVEYRKESSLDLAKINRWSDEVMGEKEGN